MRTLITGGYGYIGGYLAQQLLFSGQLVTILDTMVNAKPWDFPNKDNLYALNASVCNRDAVGRAMWDVSIIYHLASREDWNDSPRHPVRIFQTDVIGTATLLSTAHAAGVDNVVVVSSASVYGNVVGAEEWGPKEPVNLYGHSKLAMESVCRHYQGIGMNVKILRPFSVWGWEHSDSVVSRFVGPDSIVYGDGSQTRDFVHVSDVLNALSEAIRWDPSVYNIGTGDEITIGGLWARLRGGKYALNPQEFGWEEVQRCCANMEDTYQRVSWRPKISLPELSKKEIRGLCQ